ncbi:MAG: metal-dependent hydrolase [Ignavibacteria bacterium]|jgi:L-ascorbate metabolism protein UlaG (beta-lactamase superfamily)
MKIIYHGHSFVQLESKKYSILIDPFVTGNPTAITNIDNLKCDFIILTHGHGDHISDAITIAQKYKATIISSFEIANYAGKFNVKAHPMGIGGSYNFLFGRVKLTIAHHSSSFSDGKYAGNPTGALITIDGKTIYHAGDTGLFYDMKLIGEMNKIDIAFLPIGDNFTMGIDDAVKAAEFINAGITVPIHYNTFDVIKVNPEDFKKKIGSIGKKCSIINIGESIEI